MKENPIIVPVTLSDSGLQKRQVVAKVEITRLACHKKKFKYRKKVIL